MKKDKISEIIGNINDKYIGEAILYTGKEKAVRPDRLLKWGTIAACLIVALIAGIFVLPSISRNNTNPLLSEDSILIGGLARPYKDVTIGRSEIDMMWQWEYQTIYEQYTTITLNGKQYTSRMRDISKSLLGDMIGSYEAEGYDFYTEQVHHRTFEVRQIQGISDDLLIAVNLDGAYYVFMLYEYAPPATFGELLDSYGLAAALRFKYFTMHKGYGETGYYSLENDDFIWQTLTACRNAPFIADALLDHGDKNYISFTVTSEALGIYKRAFNIYGDGYVWTNSFDQNCTYNIGEKAAAQIISSTMENAIESEFEPYSNTLAGTLVEICDGYILVDDSILCSKASDGMVFRVPTEDLRVSRYIDSQIIKVGDAMVIDFTGNIDVKEGNMVTGVYSISPATISDGNVTVSE